MTKSELSVRQLCLPNILSNVTKGVALTSFQKPQLQSLKIVFKFSQPCLPFEYTVFFIPFFFLHVLSSYFYVPLSWWKRHKSVTHPPVVRVPLFAEQTHGNGAKNVPSFFNFQPMSMHPCHP